MSQSENQPDAGTTEQSAPDGLMAASALADEQEIEEGQNIEHRAESDAEETDAEPEVFDKPDWFPAKFWDEKEGPDLENIVKSYEELQKQKIPSGPSNTALIKPHSTTWLVKSRQWLATTRRKRKWTTRPSMQPSATTRMKLSNPM